jgi:hypothetical protein
MKTENQTYNLNNCSINSEPTMSSINSKRESNSRKPSNTLNIYNRQQDFKLQKTYFYCDFKEQSNKFPLIKNNSVDDHKSKNEMFCNFDLKISKILNILKSSLHLIEKQNKKLKCREKYYYEWREAARRLDLILFYISFIIITFIPIYFFGPYFFRDYLKDLPSTCGCNFK